MATKEKLRKAILNKIKKLSDDKLSNLDAYISDLESHLSTEKSTLSFSGIFKELELTELTSELHKSREDNNERIPQF
ncbi:MAG: hypothetical protein ABJ004_00990 [Cyclobacteriaceae bacterium]|uniref:Uncharacterized protein n=1 Tax=Ekhidna lutea TaxID=447679 RepID=A0A239M6T5_EKHLU|nr:hypothetical protein [Ekhidna lutea]SNT37774.1 hypothetical protein SAMN05421640_3633 [Ekhidna lutea]